MSHTDHTAVNGGYDRNLLVDAPEISKKDRQAGYDAALLSENRQAAPARSPTPPASRDPEAAHPEKYHPVASSRTPFYRTRKGITIIIVAFVVVIAAVVGGAVGGTRKKSNTSTPANSSTTPGAAPVGTGPGSSPISTSPAANPVSSGTRTTTSGGSTAGVGTEATGVPDSQAVSNFSPVALDD